LRSSQVGGSPAARIARQSDRVDVTAEFPGSHQNHAFCDAVLVADPGRRPSSHLVELGPVDAANLLRHAWPIVDLTPQRRGHQVIPKLAQQCRCGELQLSRDPHELLRALDSLRSARWRRGGGTTSAVPPVSLRLHVKSRPKVVKSPPSSRRLAV